MNGLDDIIFKNKKFSDILSEVYDNNKKREKQVTELIAQLKPLIGEDIGNASLLVPLIKEYLEIGVKNDDHLIKLSAIIQKIVSNNSSNPTGGLEISDEEKKQLMSSIEELQKVK